MEFDAHYKVESERLVIRTYCRGDAQAYQDFIGEIGRVRIPFAQAAESVRDKSIMFGPRFTVSLAAFDKQDGDIKLHMSLTPYMERVRALGYGTRPSAQNKGYMKEALGTLLRDVFARNMLDGVIADVRVDNMYSRRVLAGAGFVQDMSRREKDGWIHMRRMARVIA